MSLVLFWPCPPGIWNPASKKELTDRDVPEVTAAVLDGPAAKGSRLSPLFLPEQPAGPGKPGCHRDGENMDPAAGPLMAGCAGSLRAF